MEMLWQQQKRNKFSLRLYCWSNSTLVDWACCRCIWVYCCCCRCILHLQQYSRRLNLFLFFSQVFWTFTPFRVLHHSVLCLGSPCHPTAQSLQPTAYSTLHTCSGVQNITTQLAFQHKSGSFFIHCYTKTEILSTMQGHNDQHSDNQLVKISHSGVAVHSSLLIFLFKNSFLP